ncbi:MAG: 4Fe-4S dicluster domain-containing protein [Gemmataceae bacterium]
MLKEHVRETLPKAAWCTYEPVHQENIYRASKVLFGKVMVPRHDLHNADVVLALDADLFGIDGESASQIRGFASKRKVTQEKMNRLYVVENTMTTTGGMADHRLRLPASKIAEYVMALAKELEVTSELGQARRAEVNRLLEQKSDVEVPETWIKAVAEDLKSAGNNALVVAGARQPELVHILVGLINAKLGAIGETVQWFERKDLGDKPFTELPSDIDQGRVKTLVVLGGNPAYNAPHYFDLENKFQDVPTTIRLSMHFDETSEVCDWHLPMSHALESWGDAETIDGLYSPIQPMIEPLFGTRSALEVVAKLTNYEKTSREIVEESFVRRLGEMGKNITFDRFLHTGLVLTESEAARGEAPEPPDGVSVSVQGTQIGDRLKLILEAYDRHTQTIDANNFELSFHADASVFDGRYANNGWLQETPDPVTKLTWRNAAVMSPATAAHLNVRKGDLVRIIVGEQTVEIPSFILPGQADYSVTVLLGYGRRRTGRVGRNVGDNVYPFRSSDNDLANMSFIVGVSVTKTGRHYDLACTQDHASMEGRDLVREKTLSDYLEHKNDDHDGHHGHGGHGGHGDHGRTPLNIVEPPEFTGRHQWGMAIDLNKCVGCNACVVACQSENNIPIVGEDEVRRGREMHWIRVDRYFKGDENDPQMVHQPVACVHCENAPCETVCPVNATVHSPEGLNLQVYNRCVGTRYCSNNCPYKVRKFNWFDYNVAPLDQLRLGPVASERGVPETLKMQKNPDVTVRMRGVMEKCTYCVQRIERAKTGAKLANPTNPDYTLRDGAVTTACVQVCPAEAIVFGDLSDERSRVKQAKNDSRNYGLLSEIGTQPRTSHMARLRNPNPRMSGSDTNGE